ncbi:MAG: hypothetical protein R2875_12475 [Desulfobacterales bacterium]
MAFEAIAPVSATQNIQIPDLVTAMKPCCPAGPPYFPEDMIRYAGTVYCRGNDPGEKVFELTAQEIPFSTAVTIEL